MQHDDYMAEKKGESPDGSMSYYEFHASKKGLSWRTRFTFWGLILSGIVLGTFLFLFFLTAFVYLFLPALTVFFIWKFLTQRR